MARKRGVRPLVERFLIVCEDNCSAPQYFIALRAHLKVRTTDIEVVGSGGHTQPVQVVEAAVRRKSAAAEPDSGGVPFDQVWCVVDGDYGVIKIASARAKAAAKGVHLAVTTPCFEYWVLLHFEESDQPANDCKTMVSRLKASGHIPDYDKGKCDFIEVVPHVSPAADRARKLRKAGEARGDLPEVQNPCSELYRLVEALTDRGA